MGKLSARQAADHGRQVSLIEIETWGQNTFDSESQRCQANLGSIPNSEKVRSLLNVHLTLESLPNKLRVGAFWDCQIKRWVKDPLVLDPWAVHL